MGDKMTGKKAKVKDKKDAKTTVANDQMGENAGEGRIIKSQNKK